MIPRNIQSYVQELLSLFPATVILGPRQVGKTTLCQEIVRGMSTPAVFLEMERAEDRAKLSEPSLYLEQYKNRLMVIDEIQQYPGLFPELRAIIDKERRTGRFLITGSASPDLLRQSSETLAGRTAFV